MTLWELVIDDIFWGDNPYRGYHHKGLYETLPRDEFEKLYFEIMCNHDGINIDEKLIKAEVEQYGKLYDRCVTESGSDTSDTVGADNGRGSAESDF